MGCQSFLMRSGNKLRRLRKDGWLFRYQSILFVAASELLKMPCFYKNLPKNLHNLYVKFLYFYVNELKESRRKRTMMVTMTSTVSLNRFSSSQCSVLPKAVQLCSCTAVLCSVGGGKQLPVTLSELS